MEGTNILSMMVLFPLIIREFLSAKVDILWFFGAIVQADIELNGVVPLKPVKFLNASILITAVLLLMGERFILNLYLI